MTKSCSFYGRYELNYKHSAPYGTFYTERYKLNYPKSVPKSFICEELTSMFKKAAALFTITVNTTEICI